jgi:hypothetical protein
MPLLWQSASSNHLYDYRLIMFHREAVEKKSLLQHRYERLGKMKVGAEAMSAMRDIGYTLAFAPLGDSVAGR